MIIQSWKLSFDKASFMLTSAMFSITRLSMCNVCFHFLSSLIIFQALSQMNRLHEALAHLLTALKILGKKQPTSDLGCYIRIRKEALRHYLHVFLPGYYIGGAG